MDPNHVPFEELPITNRFMFALVFSRKHIAKPFLEAILGIKIFDLQEPEPEKSTEISPFNKGVRYDVFVKEQGPDGEITAFLISKCKWRTLTIFRNEPDTTRHCAIPKP